MFFSSDPMKSNSFYNARCQRDSDTPENLSPARGGGGEGGRTWGCLTCTFDVSLSKFDITNFVDQAFKMSSNLDDEYNSLKWVSRTKEGRTKEQEEQFRELQKEKTKKQSMRNYYKTSEAKTENRKISSDGICCFKLSIQIWMWIKWYPN